MAFFSRRSDGKLLKNITAYRKFFPYFLITRNESQLFLKQQMNIDRTLEYLEKQNAGSKVKKITLFQVFIAAAVQTIVRRPELNRFVKARRLYQRNTIDLSFSVKKELTDGGGISNAKITFDPEDTLEQVKERINKHLKVKRSDKVSSEEKEIDFLTKLPRFMVVIIMRILRFLDYVGMLPKKMIKSDPLFTSAFVSNHGSIGLDAVYHHLFNWGTASLFVLMGKMYKAPRVNDKGEITVGNFMDITFTMDNRITDGLYASKSIMIFKDLLENPEKLEKLETPVKKDKDKK